MYADALRAYSPQNEQEDADRRMILEYIAVFPTISSPGTTRSPT